MAFEPRIVRPDGPDERRAQREPQNLGPQAGATDAELWLPDDLQELAGQLSADAARLAASFPVEPPALDVVSERPRRWRPRLAAAAIVATLGLAVLGRGEFLQRPADSGRPLAIQPVRAAKAGDGSQPLTGAAIAPAFLLENLTGPEREGVLDLLEQQTLAPESVSI